MDPEALQMCCRAGPLTRRIFANFLGRSGMSPWMPRDTREVFSRLHREFLPKFCMIVRFLLIAPRFSAVVGKDHWHEPFQRFTKLRNLPNTLLKQGVKYA